LAFSIYSLKIIYNKKKSKKIRKPMPHFDNNLFSKSNKKVQCVIRIGIQEQILRFANNAIVFRNNFVGPLSINVGQTTLVSERASMNKQAFSSE
jgi:hypothetical protein